MVQQKTLDKILNQRASEYGSYKDNMYLMANLYNDVYFKVNGRNNEYFELTEDTYDSNMCFKHIKKFLSYKDNQILKQTVAFTQTMLCLKAIRSITAKGDAYFDSIADFINYVNLSMEVIQHVVDKYKLPLTIKLALDEGSFNKLLNDSPINPEEIKFLLRYDWVNNYIKVDKDNIKEKK